MSREIDAVEASRDLESMVTADDVATTEICGKLREVQRGCEDGFDAAPTTFVKVIELGRGGIVTKRMNATLSD